jgi:hypothetical protein
LFSSTTSDCAQRSARLSFEFVGFEMAETKTLALFFPAIVVVLESWQGL